MTIGLFTSILQGCGSVELRRNGTDQENRRRRQLVERW